MLAWLVQTLSTHGGEDIHGRRPGEITGKHKTPDLWKKSKPEEEKGKEQKKQRKNCFNFSLPQHKHAC